LLHSQAFGRAWGDTTLFLMHFVLDFSFLFWKMCGSKDGAAIAYCIWSLDRLILGSIVFAFMGMVIQTSGHGIASRPSGTRGKREEFVRIGTALTGTRPSAPIALLLVCVM